MLQVCELNQYYGGSHILRGVSFEAVVGEVTCLLGRNGVGKTTLLRCLMGLIPVKAGEVVWQGKSITTVNRTSGYSPAWRMFRRGGRFSASDRRRKPADGAVALLRGKRKERTGGDLAAFPGAEGDEAPTRRRSFRWSATAAGDWSRAGEPSTVTDSG